MLDRLNYRTSSARSIAIFENGGANAPVHLLTPEPRDTDMQVPPNFPAAVNDARSLTGPTALFSFIRRNVQHPPNLSEDSKKLPLQTCCSKSFSDDAGERKHTSVIGWPTWCTARDHSPRFGQPVPYDPISAHPVINQVIYF
jgi:hypothetical protein